MSPLHSCTTSRTGRNLKLRSQGKKFKQIQRGLDFCTALFQIFVSKPITAYSYLDKRISKIYECPSLSVYYYFGIFFYWFMLQWNNFSQAQQHNFITLYHFCDQAIIMWNIQPVLVLPNCFLHNLHKELIGKSKKLKYRGFVERWES